MPALAADVRPAAETDAASGVLLVTGAGKAEGIGGAFLLRAKRAAPEGGNGCRMHLSYRDRWRDKENGNKEKSSCEEESSCKKDRN